MAFAEGWTGEGEADAPVGSVRTPVFEVMVVLVSPAARQQRAAEMRSDQWSE